MFTTARSKLLVLLPFVAVLLAASPARAAWENNFAFGASLKADLYTPSTLAASPAVLVAIHYCSGNKMNAHGWFDSYADKNGFFIIAPDAGKNCFDSSATRGGDRDAIVKMVQYLIANKGANKDRVFAAGYSSGGCMTNTLLAIYPDVFKGGSAMPGFPAGAWPAGDSQCMKCSSQPDHKDDGKYWGDLARKAFTWNGKYPCSQQWVGGADEYNFNGWLSTVESQFVNLSSLDAGATGSGAPSGWVRKIFKNSDGVVWLETNTKSGQKHDLTGSNLGGAVVSFLGLDKPTGACGVDSGSTSGSGGAGGSMSGGAGMSGGGAGRNGGGAGRSGAMGGSTGSGGGMASTGGAPASSGGSTGSGGAATGGSTGSGGKASSGGANGSGGATASSGGANGTGSGGTGTGSGGSNQASGGSQGSGGSPPTPPGGCSCELGDRDGKAPTATLLMVGLGLGLVIRRRKRA